MSVLSEKPAATLGLAGLVYSAFASIFRATDLLVAAMSASREMERLSAMSDAALAEQGTSRDAAIRAAYERHFGG
ncbi:MAG: hypothetical protein AAFR47_24335 [Pseudomonadota bacterium]